MNYPVVANVIFIAYNNFTNVSNTYMLNIERG